MANITEILGTDSLSSSRPTINSNFTAINDEIADITALIDPITSTISGIDSISAEQITLATVSGGVTSQILQIDSTAAVINVTASYSEDVTFQKVVKKTGKLGSGGSGAGSTSTAPDFSTISTFFANVSFQLPAGTEGQEINVISTNPAGVTITTGTGLMSVVSLVLNGLNSSVTMKYFSANNTWYVIGSHDITWS